MWEMDKLHLLLVILVVSAGTVISQYTDDSDYDDFNFYEETEGKIVNSPESDDFYMVPDEGVGAERTTDEQRQRKPEKVYQYTKHRIPGYDYDELDFTDEMNINRCDDRSTWTHCLCQFTCTSQNAVDCYTPCKSGCECREDYVFDERTQRCVYPDQCVEPTEI